MITNKNNSGWILCPSNTFPGKFYYFNVLNGETAWSISDTEKKIIKNDGGIPEVMGNHHHPEPSSPPTAYNPVKTNPITLNQPKLTQMQHPTPVFGQSVFPKALPTKPDRKIIWTPIHIQVPIVLSENRTLNQVNQNSNQKRISQITQMPEIAEENLLKPILDIDEEVLVESCVKPLCQRFVNYEKPVISFSKDNRIEDTKLFDKFYTSTPTKKSLLSSMPTFKTIASNANIRFQDPQPKVVNQELKINKPTFNFEVPSETSEKVAMAMSKQVQPKINPSLKPKVANQKMFIKKPTFSFKVPSKTPEKVVTVPNIAFAQSEFNLSFQDLQPKVANQKLIVRKPTFNFEVPSKTPEKFAMALTERAQPKINPSFEDIQPKVANHKSIIKKPAINVEILSKTLEKVAITPNTEVFQSKMNSSFEYLRPTVANQKPIVNKAFFNVEVPSKSPEKVSKAAKKVEPKNSLADTKDFSISEKILNNFDLRMLLVAKKRMSQDLAKTNAGDKESKVIKTTKQKSTQQTKKRVTFNLDYETAENDKEAENASFRETYAATVESLKGLSGPKHPDQWCIVADTQLLLEEFSFLDRLVQIDPKCKLLIPSSVYSEVSAVSRGDCRGRTHVNHARNVMRRMNNAHIKVQSADDEGTKSPINDAILRCCVETMDQNIHLILITNNQELLTTAKCYPIPCYKIEDIKNGLAARPKALEFKQMKITIPNDTDSKFTQNGLAVHCYRQKLFNEFDDLNEKEKEILRKYKHIVPNSKNNENWNTNSKTFKNFTITKIANGNPEITKMNPSMTTPNAIPNTNSNTNPKISNAKSMICTESSRIANAIHINAKIRKPNTNSMTLNVNSNSRISSENSTVPNANLKDSILKTHSISIKGNGSHANENAGILDENSNISMTNSKANSEWQCAKTTIRPEKENTNETVSLFFQNPSKFDFQKIKNSLKKPAVSSYFQNGGPTSPFVFGKNTKPVQESNIKKPVFEATNQIKPIFETTKTKEPQKSVIEVKEKSNMAASKVDIDVYKKPQSILSNRMKKNNDLSMFYVKSKMIENRLKERMDEWLCTFRQVMEETLSAILENVTSSALKFSPPWSLLEALKCTKTLYKHHTAVVNIVDDLCRYLYDTDCTNDKTKRNLTPDDVIKSIGCGINLMKCLKDILRHSDDVLEAEKCLLNMLNLIENPSCDENEPFVKTPSVGISDDKQIGQNFIKNRSEIINYLKKHYTEFKDYEENDNIETNIVRTVGKHLLKLEKKMATGNKDTEIVDKSNNMKKLTVGTATKNFDNAKNITTYDANNPTKNNEIKLIRVKNAEKLSKNCQIDVPKESNTIDTNRVNSKDVETTKDTESKPKRIFDIIKPTEIIQKYNKESIYDSRQIRNGDKFKIDSQMLGVKIVVPNYYKNIQKDNSKEDKHVPKTPNNLYIPDGNNVKDTKETNLGAKREPKLSILCIKPTETKDRVSLEARTEIHKITGNENGPKIIRNMNFIKEFEERRINKKDLDLEELDTASQDTYDYKAHTQKNVLNDGPQNAEYNLNYSVAANDFELSSDSDNNNLNYNLDNVNDNLNCKDLKDGHVVEMKDFKNDVAAISDRKSYKDDLTDSGLGNEIPQMYCMVESFSSELEGALEYIQRFINGSIQEFRARKFSEERKSGFRLKAFEANFLLTKIINGLHKLAQKEISTATLNGDDSGAKITSRNTEAMGKCLDHAQTLQGVLNIMLTVTEDDVLALNSSMSLNASS